jgi:hypothetical protein
MRGMGRIYKRGGTYWLQYSHRGQVYRESSHSDRETDARKLLKKRLGEIGIQKFIGPTEERMTFEDLAAALLTDYEINAKRSIGAALRAAPAVLFWNRSRCRHHDGPHSRLCAGTPE